MFGIVIEGINSSLLLQQST